MAIMYILIIICLLRNWGKNILNQMIAGTVWI